MSTSDFDELGLPDDIPEPEVIDLRPLSARGDSDRAELADWIRSLAAYKRLVRITGTEATLRAEAGTPDPRLAAWTPVPYKDGNDNGLDGTLHLPGTPVGMWYGWEVWHHVDPPLAWANPPEHMRSRYRGPLIDTTPERIVVRIVTEMEPF